jgi:hypothetical protein
VHTSGLGLASAGPGPEVFRMRLLFRLLSVAQRVHSTTVQWTEKKYFSETF